MFGSFLAQSNRIEESSVQFQEYLKIKSDDPVMHNKIGINYARLGRHDEAIKHFREALKLKPDLDAAYQNLRAVTSQKANINLPTHRQQ